MNASDFTCDKSVCWWLSVGEVNPAFTDTLSKRSGLHVMSDDHFSEYSHRSEKSKRSSSLRAI